MPWRTATVANERARFVIEAEISDLSHSELCRRYGISRPTGYKWIGRYEAGGLAGLEDRSHAPHSCPHASSPEVVDRVLDIRKLRGWGARKIRQKLLEDAEIEGAPSIDTVNRILRRHGRIEPSGTTGLSQLSVWWITLGIVPELIEPGKPQQNGRHERMHRTLKKETATPPGPSLRAQQRRFDTFRRVYNLERPHEALGMETPSAIYRPSDRALPSRPEPLAYLVSSLLKGLEVGLEQVGDGVWSVYFGPVHLGWLDERDFRIMDVKEKNRRRR